MVIPLWRSVCQRLLTKSFRGGSRAYFTQVTPPSDLSSGWRILAKFVGATVIMGSTGLLANVGRRRSMDDDAKRYCEEYMNSKVNGQSANGEILMVHSAKEQNLFDSKANGKGTSMRS